ncbi:MAG: hypothetical protein WCY36_07355 [Candidatus Omnitrophota bacterium]
MAGKLNLAAEAVEELMDAQSILERFSTDLEDVFKLLDKNTQVDHENDKLRTEAVGFILKSMESYNAKDYEGMQKYNHAAVQRINEQGAADFKDDKPRIDARIMLLKMQINAVKNLERLRKITGKLDSARLEEAHD